MIFYLFQYFMMFECFMASTLFYMAHWQTYVTGQMKFGKFDVTEAQIAMISMMTVTGLLGIQDCLIYTLLKIKLHSLKAIKRAAEMSKIVKGTSLGGGYILFP